MTPAERHALVLDNLGLAGWLAARYRRRSPLARRLGWDDLRAAAVLGLVEAAAHFDPAGGRGYPGFAAKMVCWSMAKAALRAGAVTLPRAAALAAPVPGWQGEAILRAAAPGLSDFAGVAGPGVPAERAVAARLDLERLLSALPPREREAVVLWRVKGLTLRAVGRRLGVSQTRAAQLCNSAVNRLRGRAKAEDYL